MLNILNKTNADMAGFLNLSRDITEWGWYKDTNTFRVFIHLLFKANWKDGEYMGYKVGRGSLVTGRKQLACELDLSEQNIRTAINHLKSTNELTIKTTNKFSIITICKYERWVGEEIEFNQQFSQQTNRQLTNNQPTTNQQLTTIEENNKERNKEGKNNIPPIIPNGDGETSPVEISEMKRRLSELQKENDELKKNNAKKEKAKGFDVRADLSYVDEAHMTMWVEWLDYKDQIKKQYNTQVGAKKAYTQWINLSMGNLAKAQAIIDQSQMRSWDGLFDVKDWKESTNESNKPMQQPANSGMVIINGREWQV